MLGNLYQTKHWVVMYSGCLGDRFTGFGAQTLPPKKHFSSFLSSVVFQQKIRWNSDHWFKNRLSESAILDYLEAQILEISPVGRRQPWWRLREFNVYIGLPSPLPQMLDTLLLGYPLVSLALEIRVNLPADSNFRHHQKKSFSSAVRDK